MKPGPARCSALVLPPCTQRSALPAFPALRLLGQASQEPRPPWPSPAWPADPEVSLSVSGGFGACGERGWGGGRRAAGWREPGRATPRRAAVGRQLPQPPQCCTTNDGTKGHRGSSGEDRGRGRAWASFCLGVASQWRGDGGRLECGRTVEGRGPGLTQGKSRDAGHGA